MGVPVHSWDQNLSLRTILKLPSSVSAFKRLYLTPGGIEFRRNLEDGSLAQGPERDLEHGRRPLRASIALRGSHRRGRGRLDERGRRRRSVFGLESSLGVSLDRIGLNVKNKNKTFYGFSCLLSFGRRKNFLFLDEILASIAFWMKNCPKSFRPEWIFMRSTPKNVHELAKPDQSWVVFETLKNVSL
jgi:hypothetical protein